MNIQTVIANLLNTIAGKEQLLAEYEQRLCLAQMSDTATVEFLKLNLKELNDILADCMLVREAEIIKNLEHKESSSSTAPKGTHDYV